MAKIGTVRKDQRGYRNQVQDHQSSFRFSFNNFVSWS